MRQLGLIVAVIGGFGTFLSWTIKPGPADVELAWWGRGLSALCLVTPIAALVWLSKTPALAPEFLAQTSTSFFEANGLSFLPLLQSAENRCLMTVLFENRFTGKCEVTISLRPTPVAFKKVADIPSLLFRFDCPPEGYGQFAKSFAFPERLAGEDVLYDVTASCCYPDGRGDELRFRPGMNVGEIGSDKHQDLKQIVGLLAHLAHIPASHGSPARLRLKLPSFSQNHQVSEECSLNIMWSLPFKGAHSRHSRSVA